MHREFLSILPFRYSLNCKSGRDEGLPGENRPSLDPDLFSPKDVRQRPPVSSLFAENAGLSLSYLFRSNAPDHSSVCSNSRKCAQHSSEWTM